jgi:Calpain family cysteine protease/RTX calcium-binding nonapeptide repeat (4 copies)
MRPLGNDTSCIEPLESRLLLDGVPYTISTVRDGTGSRLLIYGTNAADGIFVRPAAGGLSVSDQNGNETTTSGNFSSIEVHGRNGADSIHVIGAITLPTFLYGDAGRDSIFGGGGDDTIYSGAGRGSMAGRRGNDTLISMDNNSVVALRGGAGNDSFWYNTRPGEGPSDVSAIELANGFVHEVHAFAQSGVSAATTAGPTANIKLADPIVTNATFAYKDFSDNPLFSSAGPSPTDVRQGYVGDCYFMATLAAIARVNPDIIRQSVADLGDGTYAVRFRAGGLETYIRVDGDLPTSGNTPAYARLGAQGSTWVAILEKAFAYYRNGSGTYASLGGGWMSEAFADFGYGAESITSVTDGVALLNLIRTLLLQNKAVTLAVRNVAGTPLIANHAYTVDRVIVDAAGNPTFLRLRNPWGYDGAGSDSNYWDGYVKITPQQAMQVFWAVQAAIV